MKRYFIRFWLPVLLWMVLIFYLSSLEFPGKPKIYIGEQKFSVSDILLHVTEYGILSILLFRALHNAIEKTKHQALLFAFIIASFYGILDEIHQIFVPTRFFELKDLIFNLVGSSSIYVAKKVKLLFSF